MLEIAQRYINLYGDDALDQFVADLMRGDQRSFKAGYTRENAVIAAADAFGTTRNEIEEQLS